MKIYESMTRMVIGSCVVRVWAEESGPMPGPCPAVVVGLQNLNQAILPFWAVVEALDALPMVNAYEILDIDGNGLVVYRDWP